MRMSESLRKNVFEVSVGGIINKLRIKRRRSTLFFEEMGSEYIKKCEEMGHTEDMMEIGQRWMAMLFEKLIPSSLKRISPVFLLNVVMKKVWTASGMMDVFHASKKGDTIEIETRNEGLTRCMGRNHLMVGFYKGTLNTLFKCEVEAVDVAQTRERCRYVFRLLKKEFHPFKAKEKSEYNKLNYLEAAKGFTLKDLLEKNIFQLKENNRIYFRDRSISPVESTLFHLIGNKGILLDEIPKISHDYFGDVIKDSSTTKKLTLIKTLLQAMGWGIINIIVKGKKIIFEIRNPPYGIQAEEDNWDFLIRTILGYLWLLDRKFRISKTETRHKYLKITYCR